MNQWSSNLIRSDEFKGKWNQRKAQLKQKFDSLTDGDPVYEMDKEDELAGNIQEKMGERKPQLLDRLFLVKIIGQSARLSPFAP